MTFHTHTKLTWIILTSLVFTLFGTSVASAEGRVIRRSRRVVKSTQRTPTYHRSPRYERRVHRYTPQRRRYYYRNHYRTRPSVQVHVGTPMRRYYRPNYYVYGTAPVYRYVRRPRYVWTDYDSSYADSRYVYQEADRPYIVEEHYDEQLPELDCPRGTEVNRAPYRSWCATPRGVKDGPYITYFKNGQVRTEGRYQYGTREGDWLEYHKQGGVRVSGEYHNGRKRGAWTTYDPSGEEITTVFYN